MGYRLRMHAEVLAWLAGLRDTEPELARAVGEAVVALLDAGESLGPPLAVPLQSSPPPVDVREALDHSYQRLLEALRRVRRGIADVATSRKRLELQADQLEHRAGTLARQHRTALDAGQQHLASEAETRLAAAQEQLSALRGEISMLAEEEQRLTPASQRLQARVDAFRTQKETIKASYTAAEAAQRIREAFTALGEDTSGLDAADAGGSSSASVGSALAAAGELLQELSHLAMDSADASAAEHRDSVPPPGMTELRPGAAARWRVSLLFVVEAQDTVLLLASVDDPGRSPGSYQEAIRVASARLAAARPGEPSTSGTAPGTFTGYDAQAFLDEFFPGEQAGIATAAAALAARNRTYTLTQARQRLGLTQAQVAERMSVRQEWISAVERAEPGATEVRVLAAYVQALGGRLDIIADIGGERITLR